MKETLPEINFHIFPIWCSKCRKHVIRLGWSTQLGQSFASVFANKIRDDGFICLHCNPKVKLTQKEIEASDLYEKTDEAKSRMPNIKADDFWGNFEP